MTAHPLRRASAAAALLAAGLLAGCETMPSDPYYGPPPQRVYETPGPMYYPGPVYTTSPPPVYVNPPPAYITPPPPPRDDWRAREREREWRERQEREARERQMRDQQRWREDQARREQAERDRRDRDRMRQMSEAEKIRLQRERMGLKPGQTRSWEDDQNPPPPYPPRR